MQKKKKLKVLFKIELEKKKGKNTGGNHKHSSQFKSVFLVKYLIKHQNKYTIWSLNSILCHRVC